MAAFVRAKREMSENTQAYLAFLELLPAILRDERHSERIENLYEWAVDLYLRLFAESLEGLDERQARGFAQLDHRRGRRSCRPERDQRGAVSRSTPHTSSSPALSRAGCAVVRT